MDAFGNPDSKGRYQLGRYLKDEWNLNFRIQILGFQQRGGITDYRDKIYAALFVEKALELISADNTGYLVGIHNGKAAAVPLQDVVGKKRLVEPPISKWFLEFLELNRLRRNGHCPKAMAVFHFIIPDKALLLLPTQTLQPAIGRFLVRYQIINIINLANDAIRGLIKFV